jgi:hypothetical protein
MAARDNDFTSLSFRLETISALGEIEKKKLS